MLLKVLLLLSIAAAVFGDPVRNRTRILQGTNAYLGQFRFVVSLQQKGYHFCTGTIINPNTVLTAAHCALRAPDCHAVSAVAGIVKLGQEGQIRDVKNYRVHPQYDSYLGLNNIALAQLQVPFWFNDLVGPIASPTSQLGNGLVLTSLGWNFMSHNLVWSNIQTLDHQHCRYSQDGIFDGSTQICSKPNPEDGLCPEDTGGPLILNGEIHGIAPVALRCDRGRVYFFTKVQSYLPWIISNSNCTQ